MIITSLWDIREVRSERVLIAGHTADLHALTKGPRTPSFKQRATWSRRSHSWQEPTREAWTETSAGNREASRSIPEQNALENQGGGSGTWAAPRRRGAYAHACRGALPLCKTVTFETGSMGKRGNTTGITSCAQLGMTLARLMGRPTCLRSGPLGLALCGGPFGSRQALPFVRQCQHRSLGVIKVTVANQFSEFEA